jgi:hypothetical protein
MKTSLTLLLTSISTATASWSACGSSVIKAPSFVLAVRGGANEYETKFESVKSDVLEKAFRKVSLVGRLLDYLIKCAYDVLIDQLNLK